MATTTGRRRRASSGLGKEIERAGVTGPSIATGIAKQYTTATNTVASSPPSSIGRRAQNKPSQHRSPPTDPSSWRRFALNHTWSIPAVPVVLILALYALNPTEANPVSRFIFLSYAQGLGPTRPGFPDQMQYGKGAWDFAFVLFYTLVLSFTREFIMGEILQPWARAAGISRRKQLRFMEQMYTAIYFGCTSPFGLWVMHQTPTWYFNTAGMYEGFPHRTHFAAFKFYYLFEAAYWAQQALVMLLGMEKRRKDFYELVIHHIVTLSLIWLSYRFHFTYLGLAVYITHDISDFFLALSKSMHYLDSEAVIVTFASAIGMWVYCRHYLNLWILYSLLTEFRTIGPYELNWETQQYKCWISNVITFALLGILQALNLFWLGFLIRSAYKFLVYNLKKDDRSDSDESDEEVTDLKEADSTTSSVATAVR